MNPGSDGASGDEPQDASAGFGELGRELRHTESAAELRAEAEESERLAAQSARRRAQLVDVARDALFRGDRVALHYPDTVVTGEVIHAAGDLASIRTAATTVHCKLEAAVTLHVVERDAFGGRTPERGAESFRARLFELELASAQVDVGGAMSGGGLRGRLAVVAVDHVVLDTPDGEVHVSLAAVHTVAEVARIMRG